MKPPCVLSVLGVFLALSAPSFANQIQIGFPGSSYGPLQSGVGGEFTLNDLNGTPANSWLDLSSYVSGKTSNFGPAGITSFQTFCIEKTEFIGGFTTTYNSQLSANAMYGSVGPPGDPVSRGTGWLYSQFASGVLSGYSYASSTPAEKTARKQSAALLQNAIWWLEQEGETYSALNPFMLAAFTEFGGELGARADGAGDYGVSAVNLWSGDGPSKKLAQDQLYYDAPVITSVPDGGTTSMLLGMTLSGMAFAARRLRRTR